MKVSVSNKDIIRLAAPISLSLLIPQLSIFVNNIFLGRLGERELGVNGITGVFYLLISMIGYGLSSGMQVQMSRRKGEGDNEGLAQVFTNGIMLSLGLSLALMILSLWLVPLIFGFSLHDDENIFLSVNYLYLRVWGLPFLMLTQLFNAFFISVKQSRFLIYGSLVATLVNILFDYLLIFGNAGMPKMGLQGAALSSILSELSFCLVMVGIFYSHKLYHRYPVRKYLHFDLKLSQRTLAVSSPLIVQFMFSIGGWEIFFIFVEHLGGKALAASQILRNIFGIVGIGTWAFANTCNMYVSNIIGQGRQFEVMPIIKKISILSLAYAVIVCGILLLFSREFLLLYSSDNDLITYAIPSLRVIVCATIIMSVSTVTFNGVVGTGNTTINLVMEMFCVGSYLVYCYFIIERMRSPLYLCWGSEFVYWTCLVSTSLLYLKSGRWKGKKV